MTLLRAFPLALFSILHIHSPALGQERKIPVMKRNFQFSLFPGISTNGIKSGSYFNKYSFNLFGGLSSGNAVVEIGIISNSNLKSSTGIQIGGLANIIGANSFVNLTQREERDLIAADSRSDKTGILISGILNYVLDNAKGIQISGGLNVVGETFSGVLISGIGNGVGGTAQGVMVAGAFNLTDDSVAGMQVSTFFNYAGDYLSGTQIAIVNKAGAIQGKKSTPPTAARGLQIGLINFCREMDGLQIGLINFGGDARGKQIGLINFFRKTGSKEKVRMGTPIGLLNFGSRGSTFRIHYDEVLPFNVEYTTGNCLNCSWTQSGMPFDDSNRIFNQNALIFGYDGVSDVWGFGYGFQKFLYNKASMLPIPANEKRLITYGLKFIHLNRNAHVETNFNLISRLHFTYGKRYRFLYYFAGISLNYFLADERDGEAPYKVRSIQVDAGTLYGMTATCWPGYNIGLQF
jgi:hypothetical protein